MSERTSAGRPVALVTGGSRGIGRAVCDALAPTHALLVGGRDEAAVDRVVEELRAKGVAVSGQRTQPKSKKRAKKAGPPPKKPGGSGGSQ